MQDIPENTKEPEVPQGLTRKERRQLKREAKLAQSTGQERKKRSKKYFLGFIFLLIAAGVVYQIGRSNFFSNEELGQTYPDQGREHIAIGAAHQVYNSNPPSSGWHHGQPANWGVYKEELPDEQLIHNLEHGGVWVSYRPDAPAQIIQKLEEIGGGYRAKVIVEPRAANDSLIALVSWGRVFKLDIFDEAKVREFVKKYRNQGPEFIPE
ncbi:DUF3105 domain-containing protein [Candidatus Azambacteria bacterium]|nr:DUF3105 domain-containing protein [Candidatus Azambacteria bacterium]